MGTARAPQSCSGSEGSDSSASPVTQSSIDGLILDAELTEMTREGPKFWSSLPGYTMDDVCFQELQKLATEIVSEDSHSSLRAELLSEGFLRLSRVKMLLEKCDLRLRE